MIVTKESICNGRQPQVFLDAQIEKGKIIPTDMMEFKSQKLQFLKTLNQFLGAIINGYNSSKPTTTHNHVSTRSSLYCITI